MRAGKGPIEGVAAPETANNASAQASFMPMLTLGTPSNPVMALMIGAMIMHGIQPGPTVMEEYFRRALLMSKGAGMVLVTEPISATLLGISAEALVVVLLPVLREKREVAFRYSSAD